MKANQIIPTGHAQPALFRTVPMAKPESPKPESTKKESLEENQVDLTHVEYNKVETAVRQTKLASHCEQLISSTVYRISSIVAVITALFLTDLSRAAFSSDSDYAIEIMMVIVFFFLLSDLILQSITYPSYPLSFFFWLDVVGTLTLLADMNLALSLFGTSYSDLTVARGGRAGRAARTAGSLRISRIVMWARVARLMKIARVFRFLKDGNVQKARSQERKVITELKRASQISTQSNDNQHKDDPLEMDTKGDILATDDDDLQSSASMVNHKSRAERNSQLSLDISSENDAISNSFAAQAQIQRTKHASKIGVSVADTITRDVVFGILLTVSLTPIFNSASEETYSAMYLAIDWFDYAVSANSVDDNYINVFLSDNPNICELRIDGTYYKHEGETIAELRDSEMLSFAGDSTQILLDIHEEVRFGHGMNIGFTLVIVMLFAGLAFLITSSITKLVVHPIERMTRIIQEFTKKVCFLGGDFLDQQSIVSDLLETQVIEAAVGTLSKIFESVVGVSGSPDKNENSCHENNNANKTEIVSSSYESMLPKSEGTTIIKSRDSVISINIQQKKRVFISDQEIQASVNNLDESADINSFVISPRIYPELTNVSTAMTHPVCCEYFQAYCLRHFAGENFKFVQAVSNYRQALKKEFWKVYSQFCAPDAKDEISIDSVKRKRALKLYHENKFRCDSFDNFQAECVQSLQSQVFVGFCDSKWAIAYVLNIDSIKRKYKHLKLEEFEASQPAKIVEAPEEEEQDEDEQQSAETNIDA